MLKKSNKLITGLLLVGMLTQCSPSQLEDLEPYQYYFDKFDEVPVIVVPSPQEISYPVLGTGGMKSGPVQVAFMEDISSGASRGEISSANLILLNEFYLTQEGNSMVNLTDKELEQLLDPNTQVDPGLIEVLSKVMDNPKLKELLSELIMPTIDGLPFSDPDARKLQSQVTSTQGARVNSTSPETLVTPCKKAAEESYLVRLGLLNKEMEASIDSNQQKYALEVQHLDSLQDLKTLQFEDSLAQTREFIRVTAVQLNQAALQLFQLGILTEMEFIGLKTFITIWVVQASLDLAELKVQQFAALSYFYETSIERLDTASNLFLYQLNQSYQNSLSSLNEIYVEVLENCHNQGGGSD